MLSDLFRHIEAKMGITKIFKKEIPYEIK